MASYNAAEDEIAVHRKTLVADTVDTVTFDRDLDKVEIISDGADELFVRVDGEAATVNGAKCYRIPAGGSAALVLSIPTAGDTEVSLISPGTTTYSVQEAT